MPVPPPNDASILRRALRIVRARLVAERTLSRLPMALAAALALGLGACALLGPTPSTYLLVSAFLAPLLPFVALGVEVRRRLAPYTGAAVSRVLAPADPWLASALASAAEFRGDAAETALVRAHRRDVVARLARTDFRSALPIARTARRSLALCAAVLALALPAGAMSADVRMGFYALTHPFAERQGTRLAAVVDAIEIHVTPPPHRGTPPVALRDPTRIEAWEGSRVRLVTRLRAPGLEVEVGLGDATLRLARRDEQRFEAETVVRTSSPLVIRVRTLEGWVRDASPRTLVVIDDAPPAIRVVTSSPESPLPGDSELRIVYEATDDVGLGEIVRVIRPPSGVEQRTVLDDPAPKTRSHRGESRLQVTELGLRPGDTFTVFLEAFDRDTFDGPKSTRTEPLTFVVDDGRQDRERATADLRGLLDASLDALAARLETDRPSETRALVARGQRLATTLEGLLERLVAVVTSESTTAGISAPDRGFLRALQRKLTPLPEADRSSAARGLAEVERSDERATVVLEEATLGLADLLGRVELEDAASLAREIAALQRELTTLVRELRENPSESLRNAVRATMERIRNRMSELESRLARMQEELPSEFRNAATASVQQARNALSDLERAFEGDDFDAMDRSVATLEQALRDMTQRSGGAEEEFTQSRFGPRQRAFTDAFQQLAELEVEEQALANDSARIRDSLSSRALSGLGDTEVSGLSDLADEARRLERSLGQLSRLRGAPIDHDALQSARARMGDAREALAHGNVGDARQSLRDATSSMEAIAEDLELSRRMFDSEDGRIAQAAGSARATADALRQLDDRVTRQIPSMESHLRAVDDTALSANRQRQIRAEESASSIAETLDGRALGEPLAPDVAEGLREAATMMAEARNSLFNRDPIGAASAQARAARRLRELREDIERQSSSSSGGGGGGGGGGSDGSSGGQRVELPGASTSEDAAARRRRVLDAMGDDVPEQYRGSVRRYYEELLR